MKRLNLVLGIVLVLGMVLAVSCGGAAPAPTVTVTKTAPAAPAPTVTVTTTAPAAPAMTVTAPPVTVTVTPTPAKLVKVRDSQATGGTMMFFALMGKKLGFSEKRGIDHEVKEMAASTARVAPFVGQADISAGDIMQFTAERKDIRLIGPAFNLHHTIMVRKGSPYRSYNDLKGKKIGILGPATGQYNHVKVIIGLEGLNLEKDFVLTHGDVSVQIGWLLKGEVEAIHLYEPFISKLLVSDGDKVRELLWLNDLYKKNAGSNYIMDGIYTSEAWVKANPELAKQAGLAYDDTLLYLYGHPEAWKGDVAKSFWKVEDPAVLELLVQRMPRLVEKPPYSPAYKAALVKKAQLMADAGLLPAGVTVDWFKGIILFAD